jgi:adenosylmethionine-8-amino-7-oxononanoate aminotransferase
VPGRAGHALHTLPIGMSERSDTVAGFNNVIALAPPLIITEDELAFIAGIRKRASGNSNGE